jgi:hypothetical protein
MPPRRSHKGSRDRPIGLIRRVIAGEQAAWEGFVKTYSGFLYSLAWRYARGDVDLASELVLVALEGLRKPDAEGREFYRLPKEIGGLDPLDQDIFKLVFWEGLSESEAFGTLSGQRQALGFEDFQSRLERIYAKLSEKNLLTIYQDLLRRMPSLPLGSKAVAGGMRPVQVADAHPEARPDRALEQSEDRAVAQEVQQALSDAIAALPRTTRQVLLLHALRQLSGEEVRRIMGFRKRQRVYDELAKAKKRIGSLLEKKGVDEDMVRRSIGYLDGLLEKNRD